MIHALAKIILSTLAVVATAYILPGVMINGWVIAIITAVVLAVMNAVVKPILIILTLPVTLVTLGLFLFVINALTVMLAAWIIPGFEVSGFWWALLFSLVVSLVSSVLYSLAGEKR